MAREKLMDELGWWERVMIPEDRLLRGLLIPDDRLQRGPVRVSLSLSRCTATGDVLHVHGCLLSSCFFDVQFCVEGRAAMELA